jgi:hypothetical protein
MQWGATKGIKGDNEGQKATTDDKGRQEATSHGRPAARSVQRVGEGSDEGIQLLCGGAVPQ